MGNRRMDERVQQIKRILVPLDLNRLSEGKIPVSESQALAFGAELILLHVIPNDPPANGSVTPIESQALTYLDAIATRLRSEGVEVRTSVRYGPVADTILDEISAQEIDLIVIGSNIRRGLSRLLVGSVAEEIIARAPCPVLLVRPKLSEAERPRPVRSFDEDVARAGPVAPHRLGIRTVEIARIIGSVGRAAELDENFRVRNPSPVEMDRYKRILKAMREGEMIPPIALYKLGYGYYVLDGNHRVAAAKELGQLEIEAEVTEFVPLRDPVAQRMFIERRTFERVTGLTRIGAAQPGHYAELEAMIREFAQEMGFQDMREAARLWEAKVYQPVARRIRSLRLGQHFPGQRTADVFVLLAAFRKRESERRGEPLDWEEALVRFRSELESIGVQRGAKAPDPRRTARSL